MYTGKLVFSQVMEHLPLHVFHRCVDRYNGEYKVKEFTCLDNYLCMAFAQLTYRGSLRDRSLPACPEEQAVPMGIRSAFPAIHWQTRTRSATGVFMRPCTVADTDCPEALPQRRLRVGNSTAQSMPWMQRHRSVPLHVPMGQLQKDQGSGKTSYTPGFTRQYPDFHLHFRRKAPRGQDPRSFPIEA
jgi:hypothetical protein